MAEELQHEELDVYTQTMQFLQFIEPQITDLPNSRYAVEQLDRNASRIPEHIAIGTYRQAQRPDQFQQAIKAALECCSHLDVLASQDLIDVEVQSSGKDMLEEVISGLSGEAAEFSTKQSDNQQTPGYRAAGNQPDSSL